MRAYVRHLAVAAGIVAAGLASSSSGAAAQTKAPIYPESDPAKDIATALAKAKQDGKHVLLDFGADWCPDCRVLGALFEDPGIVPFADANFHIVRVDIGRRDKNTETVAKYQATSGDWIPAVVVLDPAGKAVAVTDDKVRLTRRTSPSELLALLQQWAPKKQWVELSSFTERGVHVTLALDRDSSGQVWLAGRFTPATVDTHLYGKDLPAKGINGLGRPTRLEVSAASGWEVRGDLVADRPIVLDHIEELNTTLPIYPAGPVTLSVPVRLPARGAAIRREISVSYMACSDRGCLPPVIDKRVSVVLPR